MKKEYLRLSSQASETNLMLRISTSIYLKGKEQKKVVNKKQQNGVKKFKKMSDKKEPCPPRTPLLSTSHHRSLRPHYRFGS